VRAQLEQRGLLVKSGTIVDATILAASGNTKNASGQRDPEMGSTQKGGQWHFGMKAHIGVDAQSGLVHSVMTGETAFAHVFGADAWKHRQRNSALGERFDAELNIETARAAAAIVSAYDFSSSRVLCDVGGGYGALLCAILAACPAMRGMLLEQAHVAIGARSYVESQGLGKRCRVVEGDFFEGVPEGADTYVMKSIVHDWPDARAAAILGNCGKALKAGGRVILIERLMPALANDAPDTVRVDLHMLAVTGGRERSEAEYRQLLEAAGFSLRRIVPTRSPFCVIEGMSR